MDVQLWKTCFCFKLVIIWWNACDTFSDLESKYSEFRPFYTDGSRDDHKVAAAMVTTNETSKSIFSAEALSNRNIDQTVCSDYLVSGLYGVTDEALTASTIWYGNTNVCGPQNARLHSNTSFVTTGNASSWCAGINDDQQYIQVQFPRAVMVNDVVLQGRGDASQWVETYNVMYSIDNVIWSYVTSSDQQPTVFTGNSDRNTVVKSRLVPTITTVYLRIRPLTFREHVSLRFDVSGCYKIMNTDSRSEFYRLPILPFQDPEHYMFEVQKTTIAECGQQCHKADKCTSFSFEINQTMCRGYTSGMNSKHTPFSARQAPFFLGGIFTALGFRQIPTGHRLFKINEIQMNQTTAADLCIQHYSHLMKIESETEMFGLQSTITRNNILVNYHNKLFVSGMYVSNQWEHSDGDVILGSLWSPGNPDTSKGHCVMLTQTGLASVDCSDDLFSVCGLL